jgi:hypothetical protein
MRWLIFLILFIGLSCALDSYIVEHFIYTHLGDVNYYSLSNVFYGKKYYVVSVSGEPHMIVTGNTYTVPKLVTDKAVIKKVLVLYYNLTSENPDTYINQSLTCFAQFNASVENDMHTKSCIKYLGLHKDWCDDRESCRRVCFHKEFTCRDWMLALRWTFLDAMVDYSKSVKRLKDIQNTTYSFESMQDYERYVNDTRFMASLHETFSDNALIKRWRFCVLPDYDWDNAEKTYTIAVKAYYAKYPEQSLETLSENVMSNTYERVLMFQTNNYLKRIQSQSETN